MVALYFPGTWQERHVLVGTFGGSLHRSIVQFMRTKRTPEEFAGSREAHFSRSALSFHVGLAAAFNEAKLSEPVALSLDSQLLDEKPGFETTAWDGRLAESEANTAGASDCRCDNLSCEELGSLLCDPATLRISSLPRYGGFGGFRRRSRSSSVSCSHPSQSSSSPGKMRSKTCSIEIIAVLSASSSVPSRCNRHSSASLPAFSSRKTKSLVALGTRGCLGTYRFWRAGTNFSSKPSASCKQSAVFICSSNSARANLHLSRRGRSSSARSCSSSISLMRL